MTIAIQRTVPLLKVDRKLGIALGFAIVCKEVKDGKVEDYYDLHGDHISEEVMLKAAMEFAQQAERPGKVQHTGEKVADVCFMFPFTEEFAKQNGFTADRFGLLIGYKPHSEQVLDDIEKGVYAGFSLGGEGIRQEVAA